MGPKRIPKCDTPASNGTYRMLHNLQNQHKLDDSSSTSYRDLIQTLLHIAEHTRPDIAFATSLLHNDSIKPTRASMKLALRVLGYLWHTRYLGFHLTDDKYQKAPYHSTHWKYVNIILNPKGNKSPASVNPTVKPLSIAHGQMLYAHDKNDKIALSPPTDNHHRVASGAPPKLSDDPFNKLSTAKSVLRVPIANTCEGLTSILTTPMNEQDFILVRDKIMGLPTTDKNKRFKCMNTRDFKHNLEKRAT